MHSLLHLALAGGVLSQRLEPAFRIHRGDVDGYHAQPTLTKRQQSEPCGEIRKLSLAYKARQSKPGAVESDLLVPAQYAYDCVMSVPVDVEGDLKEIAELKDVLQYQATLSWLKDGAKYQRKPLDIMTELDQIANDVKNNQFTSDYEVQMAIRTMIDSAGDFHLQYVPDITQLLQYARPELTVASISEDGTSLPKIYLITDLPPGGNATVTASPIVKINGVGAEVYLEALTNGTVYHDIDARYNNAFPNPPKSGLGSDSGGLMYTNYVYPGPNTTVTFANGTEKQYENVASVPSILDWRNVTDGPSFFDAFCSGPEKILPPTASNSSSSATPTPRSSSVASATPTGLLGYPEPVFIEPSKQVSGYYLNGSNYEDVAVLALPGFQPTSTDPESENPSVDGFVVAQTFVRNFLIDAVRQKKQKLVIDLRGNGGGTIDFGFELFKQLFPTVEPYGAARYRAHEAFHLYSALTADVAVDGVDKDGVQTANLTDADNGIQSSFLWSNVLDVNDKPYKNYQDYYGPDTINGDTFTSIRRYNFSNNLGGHTLPVNLTGYNQFKNITTQPFKAENIIIVQDGFCGSTCAIFAELMREQAKVQTIAVGGRPFNQPMQGVGGSKGSQILPMNSIKLFAMDTVEVAKQLDGEAVAKKLNDTTAAGRIYGARQILKRSFVSIDGEYPTGSVNSLNNERMNDTTHTPLEFIYEAADCKIFYTAATYLNVTELWNTAVDAKWFNGKCVPGSTGDKTAIGVVENNPGFGQSPKSNSTGLPTQNTSAASAVGVSGLITGLVVVVAMIMAL